MNPSPDNAPRLRIEALETRTLLAGAADPFGLVADYDTTMLAVSGTGEFTGSFSSNWGNRQLVLTGSADSSITIDMDKLPAFITNLTVSSFKSVTLTGTDSIGQLVLSDVGSFTATNLTVTTAVAAHDVGYLEVGATSNFVNLVFTGRSAEASIGNFGDGSTISSSLEALTLSTQDDYVGYNVIATPEVSDHYLYLKNYTPGLQVDPDGVVLISNWKPPVDDPTAPTNPADPTNPETPTQPETPTDPVTPDLPTDPHEPGFVIVDLPLDERMRAFVMELRSLLATSSGDIDGLVAEYLAHREQSSSPLAIVADGAGRATVPVGHEAIIAAEVLPPTVMISTSGAPTADILQGLILPDGIRAAVTATQPTTVEMKDFDVHFDAGGPLEFVWKGINTAVPATPDVRRTNHSDGAVETDPTIAESMRALGSYIADRVTAEFTPGQQSFVLLVDPPPPRGLTAAKKALADRAAATPSVGLTAPAPEIA